MDTSLNELYKSRLTWSEMTKNLGFDLSKILANLYTTKTHFLFELLQNAEDVGAASVTLSFTDEFLHFRHDAAKKFDLADITSITSIGKSTKAADLTKIGKFGIGIKSIFAVADAFEIHSGEYAISIRDFVVPVEVENKSHDDTLFVIKFKDRSLLKEVRRSVSALKHHTLLFLSTIEEIRVYDHDILWIHHEKKRKDDGSVSITVNHVPKTYLVYKSGESKLDTAIAVGISDAKPYPVPAFFNCFFETEFRTDLNFLVHAPVMTTPSRDNVPLHQPENKTQIVKLLDLFESVILDLKDRFDDRTWLPIMPLEDRKDNEIYSMFSKRFWALLRSERILTDISGTKRKLNELIISERARYREVLDARVLHENYSCSQYAVAADDYEWTRTMVLKGMRVLKLIDYLLLLHKHSSSLNAISNEDLSRLYNTIPAEINIVKYAIIRMASGQYKSISEVYLPNQMFTLPDLDVCQYFVDNSRHILNRYNVKEMELYAYLDNYVMPKYKEKSNDVDRERYENDLRCIWRFLNNYRTHHYRSGLLEKLGVSFIFLSTGGSLEKPVDLIMAHESHEKLASLTQNYKYCDIEGMCKILDCSKDSLSTYLLELGVQRGIWFTYHFTAYQSQKDYHLEGLQAFLDDAGLPETILFLELLKLSSRPIHKTWSSNRYHYTEDASWVRTLKETAWLFALDGKRYKPVELSLGAINPRYNAEDFKTTFQFLGFITETDWEAKVKTKMDEVYTTKLQSMTDEEKLLFLYGQAESEGNDLGLGDAMGGVYYESPHNEYGVLYEHIAFTYLKKHFAENYTIIDTDTGFEGKSETGSKVSLVVMDRIMSGYPGYDFTLQVDDNVQHIEVKGSKRNYFVLSREQFATMVKEYGMYRLILIHRSEVVYDSVKILEDIGKRILLTDKLTIGTTV